MASYYGSINLTRLSNLVRSHQDKVITLKNGEKIFNVNFNERRQPSQYGDTHYLSAGIKANERLQTDNIYLGDFKPSKNDQQSAPAQAPAAAPAAPAAHAAQQGYDPGF